jgi:hypothetical protein
MDLDKVLIDEETLACDFQSMIKRKCDESLAFFFFEADCRGIE